MTAWERARELLGDCLPRVPRGKVAEVGDFFFDGKRAFFSYHTLPPADSLEESRYVSADFGLGDEGGGYKPEDFVSLCLVANGRARFLMEHEIYDEPRVWNGSFPAFYFKWEREPSGAGALRFFRIDFSEDDFVNYEGERLEMTIREGNAEHWMNLPRSLAGVPKILGEPLPHVVTYDDLAESFLKLSCLEAFAKACSAVSS